MKFKFSLETLRKHRKNLEEVARRDYAEAKNESDEILNKINDLYNQSDSVRSFAGDALGPKPLEPAVLQLSSEFIDRNKLRIERKKQEFRQALSVTEQKHEVLVEAAKETKVLDKLKEKKLAEFKKEMKKQDRKITDEIVVQRHKRGRAHEE